MNFMLVTGYSFSKMMAIVVCNSYSLCVAMHAHPPSSGELVCTATVHISLLQYSHYFSKNTMSNKAVIGDSFKGGKIDTANNCLCKFFSLINTSIHFP